MVMRRDLAPAEDVAALIPGDCGEHLHHVVAGGLVVGGEEEAGTVVAFGRQEYVLLLADLAEEVVGHLDEDACAVAGIDLAAAGAAVLQVLEGDDAVADDLVRLLAVEADDEADAAGVMLVLRV